MRLEIWPDVVHVVIRFPRLAIGDFRAQRPYRLEVIKKLAARNGHKSSEFLRRSRSFARNNRVYAAYELDLFS